MENPRKIDQNLVDAQQARRVLDRLVGYELSPVLWRKVKRGLSAGRVSPWLYAYWWKRAGNHRLQSRIGLPVVALFETEGRSFKAELNHRFKKEEEAAAFLHKLNGTDSKVGDLETKPAKRSPAPPFTTSTLQQKPVASLDFRWPRPCRLLKLYEAGLITYMRTDSVNLSEQAIQAASRRSAVSMGRNTARAEGSKANPGCTRSP